MFQNDKYIQTDIKTIEKINSIPEYYTKLQIANEYIQKFHIQDEISFCLYLQTTSLNQPFEGISYNDIQAFKRFQEDPEYYERVQTILKEKEQSSKGKIIKFSKYIDIKKDKE